MADDIDLSGKQEPEPEAKKTGSSKKAAGAEQVYTRTERGERAWERDLRERITRTQTRLIEWLEGRGDTELATVLKEDGAAMAGGLIAFMQPASLAGLRRVAVAVLTVVEPLLAFGRLFRILGSRLATRRQERTEEYEAAAAEAAAAEEAEAARQAGGLS